MSFMRKCVMMAAVVSLGTAGCASSSKDRYEDLNSAEGCKASPAQINFRNALEIGAKPAEGELDDSSCVVISGVKTSYFTFKFTATASSQEFDVRVAPKARGFGFGGEHTLFIPVLRIPSGASIQSFPNDGYIRESNAWSGDKHHFGFVVKGLTPGKSYILLVTSDNSNPGKRLTTESMPNYGAGAAGLFMTIDTSLFIGPFGDFEIKMGKYREQKS